jgi:hypothetical protein
MTFIMPCAQQMSQDVSAHSGFLLHKAAMLIDMTKDGQTERDIHAHICTDIHTFYGISKVTLTLCDKKCGTLTALMFM